MVNQWLRPLDELLRGERVRADMLLRGEVDLKLRHFVPMAWVLGAVYGFFMGWYALFGKQDGRWMQVLATTLKLPALFLLTLGVTFPSLYVFNALVGCRMNFMSTARVLVAAIVLNLTVAASLGPILAFFTFSTTSYPFMVLLNVVLLGVGGFLSVGFLLRALRALARSRAVEEVAAMDAASPPPPPPRMLMPEEMANPVLVRAYERQVAFAAGRVERLVNKRLRVADLILTVWVVIYVLVGSQMGWILRPFIGNPATPFAWFRDRGGSFFGSVWETVWSWTVGAGGG